MKRQTRHKQLAEVAQLPALVPMEDFSFPYICWKCSIVQGKQFRRSLECMEDKFLPQLISEPKRGDTPLDMLFMKKEGL